VLLGEPPRTQGDLHFRAFGIPVRIHPFFWIIAILLGLRSPELLELLAWVIALFVAILVHELGHAFLMRRFGLSPWITLYGFGGLTTYNPSESYRARNILEWQNVAISAAGPAAGFLLAATVVGIFVALRQPVQILFGPPYGIFIHVGQIGSPAFTMFINYLLFISIFWGIINLMPVYPLDGGQIARELLVRANPQTGIQKSLMLSTLTATALAVVGLIVWKSFLVCIFFGYMAYGSYTTLQAYNTRGPRW